jgi:hypothetical protein
MVIYAPRKPEARSHLVASNTAPKQTTTKNNNNIKQDIIHLKRNLFPPFFCFQRFDLDATIAPFISF